MSLDASVDTTGGIICIVTIERTGRKVLMISRTSINGDELNAASAQTHRPPGDPIISVQRLFERIGKRDSAPTGSLFLQASRDVLSGQSLIHRSGRCYC